MSVHHVHIVKIPVHREHFKLFLAYVGAFLMIADASWATFGHALMEHYAHSVEPVISTSGKTGAAMAGAAAFFDRLVKVAQ